MEDTYLRKMRSLIFPLSIVLSLILSHLIYAGVTGKIAGKVTDANTGEPLIGANIIIEGTTMGAATDDEGDYFIINLPPGKYNLKASMIGYTAQSIIDVEVNIDRTTNLDIELDNASISTEDVVVIAEKQVIRKDLTSSIVEISAKEIELSPQRNVQSMLKQQRGVILGFNKMGKDGLNGANTPSDELHLRGGREGETAFTLNGIVITDPMWGGAQFIQNSSGNYINEFNTLAGTFNAEYGNAMSGVINVVTKKGNNEKYDVDLSVETDNFGVDKYDNNTFQGDIGVGGPIGSNVTFYLSGERKSSDGYIYGYKHQNWVDSEGKDIDPVTKLPAGDGEKLSMDRLDFVHGTALLKLKITPEFMVTAFGSYGNLRNDSYVHTYKYNRDGLPINKSDEIFGNLNILHAVSSSSYYEIGFARQEHTRFLGVYDNWDDYKTLETFDPSGNFSVAGESWSWENEDWSVNTIRAAFASQVNKTNFIKVGGNLRLLDIHLESKNPNERGVYWFNYTHKPTEITAFLQDKMEFSEIGLIINIGARVDSWNPDSPYWTDIVHLLDMKTEQATVKTKFSPRLGVSYPISDNAAFHFAYGHFYQLPSYYNLYGGQRYLTNTQDKDWNTSPQYQNKLNLPATFEAAGDFRLANSNMEPEKTVAYEVGLQIKLSEDVSLDVTAFYKEVSNLVGVRYIGTANYGNGFNVSDNFDYANAKGVEFSLNKRLSDYFSFRANYTFSVAKVTSSSPWAQLQNDNATFKTFTSDWDIPHTFNCDLYVELPDIVDISLSGNYQTGLPYTVKTEPNTERGPDISAIDIKIIKKFNVFDITSEIYLTISNLTDRKNVYSVYSNSGKADLPLGVPRTPNNLNIYDIPNNYSPGRTIYLGASIGI